MKYFELLEVKLISAEKQQNTQAVKKEKLSSSCQKTNTEKWKKDLVSFTMINFVKSSLYAFYVIFFPLQNAPSVIPPHSTWLVVSFAFKVMSTRKILAPPSLSAGLVKP